MTAVTETVARLEAILPQTQCRQCGFDGCRPYAAAMAEGRAPTDRCPPGGNEGARQLAEALNLPYRPVDPQCGPPKQVATRAVIDEAVCIGCTKCIQACPVDAIVGANQLMHTVIAAECTGCELCIPPCPVDCIAIVPATQAGDYRQHLEMQRLIGFRRHHARLDRIERQQQEQAQVRAQRKATTRDEANTDDPVARALAAARARTSK